MALSESKIKGLQEHAHGADGPEKDIARRVLAKNGIPLKDPKAKAQPFAAGTGSFRGQRPPHRSQREDGPQWDFDIKFTDDSPFESAYEELLREMRGRTRQQPGQSWSEKLQQKMKENEARQEKIEWDTVGNYSIPGVGRVGHWLFVSYAAHRRFGPVCGTGVWDELRQKACFSKLTKREVKQIADEFTNHYQNFGKELAQLLTFYFSKIPK